MWLYLDATKPAQLFNPALFLPSLAPIHGIRDSGPSACLPE